MEYRLLSLGKENLTEKHTKTNFASTTNSIELTISRSEIVTLVRKLSKCLVMKYNYRLLQAFIDFLH